MAKRGTRGGSELAGAGVGRDGTPRGPSLPKTDAEKASIVANIRDNILFKDLDQRLLDELVNAVFPVSFPANHDIIKQGEEGENFYIVAEGEAEAHVRGKVAGDPPVKVQHLRPGTGPGTSFGQDSSVLHTSTLLL